ncbi:hypothetical protein AVEN_194595-1 [Araneus ventricosus]|uniref:Uncharacterized protein n=1 Tax=Araneus ventricosus TaxID=182803 RepID=A0A4Y2A6P2_ARAVE|nr:hypothetical protein AVEN_194595-1 [Araneus ventricosus]
MKIEHNFQPSVDGLAPKELAPPCLGIRGQVKNGRQDSSRKLRLRGLKPEELFRMRGVKSSLVSDTAVVPSHIQRGPRWPSGKAPSGPEDRRFETRFHRRSIVYGACCTLNHT